MKFDRRLTDEIYTSDTVRLGKDAFQAMQETIYHNGGVGTIAGYYDAELSILSVSDLLLHNLNHSYASLMEQTKGSLKNLFYKRDATFLDNARFRQLQGEGEGRILTADVGCCFWQFTITHTHTLSKHRAARRMISRCPSVMGSKLPG